ncbi:MAG: MFS transporter [Pseudomonadales bacterium]
MVNTAVTKDFANPFDDWRSIGAAIFMALVGYTVMVSVPVLSTALVHKVGFTEEQVGRIWGADLGGLSLGAIIVALLVARMNRRHLVFIGVALSIVANALCMVYTDYDAVLMLRVLAGVGSGIFTAVAVVTLGGTTNPTTAYNLELVGFAFSTALELNYLPQLTMNEIYLFFMILGALCAVIVFWMPARPLGKEQLAEQEKHQMIHENWRVPKIMPWLCLTAICFTYINIGGYFTYIELAALADGVSQEWSGTVLTWSSFLGIVGCLIAYVCTRYGLFKPLFFSLIVMAAIVAMLALGINDINLAISLFGFMTLWTFVDVYQASMIAHMDRSGTLVALLPSVQGFGQFIGPNIAASIVGAGLGYPLMFVVSGSMALVALVLYIAVSLYMNKRTAENALAEAS